VLAALLQQGVLAADGLVVDGDFAIHLAAEAIGTAMEGDAAAGLAGLVQQQLALARLREISP
jgi:ATP-dependent protease HslVU (ClpYQ) peptidase subunit